MKFLALAAVVFAADAAKTDVEIVLEYTATVADLTYDQAVLAINSMTACGADKCPDSTEGYKQKCGTWKIAKPDTSLGATKENVCTYAAICNMEFPSFSTSDNGQINVTCGAASLAASTLAVLAIASAM